MLNDSVFDEMACALFYKIRHIKNECEIREAISSFLQTANIPSDRMNRQFYPTFMAHCTQCCPAISPVASSVFLSQSEWNGKPLRSGSEQLPN